MEFKVTRNKKKFNEYTLKIDKVTAGYILTIQNALKAHSKAGSVLAPEILLFLNMAIKELNDDALKG